MNKLKEQKWAVKEKGALYNTVLQEQLVKLKLIKAGSFFEYFNMRLFSSYRDLRTDVIKNQKLSFWIQSGESFIFMIAQVFLFIICGLEIIKGEMSVGTFTILLSYFTMLLGITKYMANIGNEYIETTVSVDRLNEYLNQNLEKEGVHKLERIDSIELDSLTYGYTKALLNNISCDFVKGKIYTIIGENGRGKTTLLDIISGINREYFSGLVYYNGVDIDQVEMLQIRNSLMDYCMQEPYIIDGNLLENIKLGRDNINMELAAKLINGFGLEHLIDKDETRKETLRITNLSGGEMQKISLIRSFVSLREVIIMDEPTSSLDRISKNFFINHLQNIKQNRIIIVVTHDDDLIQVSDERILLA